MKERVELTIEGMTCEHCLRAVKGRLLRTTGVDVEDVAIGSAVIQHDPQTITLDEIEDAIADEGYTAFRAG
jgi:copper chaperone